MNFELVDLGASELDERSGVVWSQCKGAPIDENDAPDFGKAPLMAALGVAARPAPANDKGSAQGVAVDGLGGIDGAVIAAHDPRAAKVYGEISAGETAVFATGDGFDSRALCKEQLFAIVVGDDYVVTVDRKNKSINIACPGGMIQVSAKTGITLCDSSGNGSLRLDGGTSALLGQVILGGGKPFAPVSDSIKVQAELAKISASIASLITVAGGGAPYVPAPVGAAGVFLGK